MVRSTSLGSAMAGSAGSSTDAEDVQAWLADAPTSRLTPTSLATYTGTAGRPGGSSIPSAERFDVVVPAAGLPWFMALFGRDS